MGVDSSATAAVLVIQRAWRSFQSRRLFKFYRDLIRERERGDPKVLLRMVNPKEAELAGDAALGTHVRLRLGGLQFPPAIYYKVFTHRPVADVGAFAPRDYVLRAKVDRPRNLHTLPNLSDLMGEALRVGWYQRVENNGWRPISHRRLADPDDPISRYTAARRMVFHPLNGVRREERIVRQKQRQREWMTRMYLRGNDDGSDGDGEGGEGRGRGGRRMAGGEEDAGDWDEGGDADLVAWSAGLDFSSYLQSWQQLGTTASTVAAVPAAVGTLGFGDEVAVHASARVQQQLQEQMQRSRGD